MRGRSRSNRVGCDRVGSDMSMPFIANPQAAADKEARRLCRLAYKTGGTVPYGLSRLLELKLSMKVVLAIYRGAA